MCAASYVERLRRRVLPAALVGVVVLVRLLPGLGRGRSVLLAGGILLSAALPLGVAVATGLLIGSIPATVRDGLGSASGATTTRLLVAIGVLVVLQRVAGPVLSATASTLGRDLNRSLQERVLAAVGTPNGIGHLEDPEVLDEIRVARGLGAGMHQPALAVEALPQLVPGWLRAMGSAAVLLAFSPWLGLVWLVMLPIVIYLVQRELLKVARVIRRQAGGLRRSEYLRDLALTAVAAKEIRVWGMLGWLVSRFETAWRTAIAPVWAARRPRPAVVFGAGGVIAVVNAVSYGILAWAAVRGDLGLGALAVYVQALAMANAIGVVGADAGNLVFPAVTVLRALGLPERLRATTTAPPRQRPAAVSTDAPRAEVRFTGVSFGYPHAEREALSGVDLVVPAGRSLAIVGENGAGKTSLVKLLCRLYEPTGGRITVDGTDLADLDPGQWQRSIAVLFQDFVRYHLPVRDNIGLGAPDHVGDLDRLRAAADQAGILETIEALPHGWDTVLSREYTQGADLSGGQWQRVALARAMFAVGAGARLLVLDEPTAALDVRAEADLYDRFLDLTQGLTTILISHRFSTVRRVDRIVVLAGGGIVEDGSHDALLAAGGRYAHMFNLQAQRFRADAAGAVDGDRDA